MRTLIKEDIRRLSKLQFGSKASLAVLCKFLLFFLPFVLNASSLVYFIPPQDWDLIDPQKLGKHTQVGFFLKNSSSFSPTLTLAKEQLPKPLSLADYALAAKKIHVADPNNRWRDLGSFKSLAGDCHLSELESKTRFGQVRLLQLFFIQDQTAYILTASALKEEFSRFYEIFKKTFRSLQSTSDLLTALTDVKKRERFSAAYAKLLTSCLSQEEWEKMVIADCSEMGAYWQALLIKQAREKTFNKEHP